MFDNWLENIYIDVTELPISVVKLMDWKEGEKNCRVLEEDGHKMDYMKIGYNGDLNDAPCRTNEVGYENGQELNYMMGRNLEEVNIMATYTHPAITASVYD